MRTVKIAQTLCWEIQATHKRVRCVIQPEEGVIALLVTFGHEEIRREIFDAPFDAKTRANELRQRLVGNGWRDVTAS
jgi:hypothetical protein